MGDTPRHTDRELVGQALGGDAAALERIVVAIQDDVYNLAIRVLGEPPAAEDATQEILTQVITHLGQWRAEAALSTWVWRIAVRHLLRQKRTAKEELCSFEALEAAIAAGSDCPPIPALPEAELTLLEKELRLDCTEAMILSLDRDSRIAWVLGEVSALDSGEAAEVLDVEAATYRKRLQRARQRLGQWMYENCGLVNSDNPCSCRRQIPVALAGKFIERDRLKFANHPERPRLDKHRLKVVANEVDDLIKATEVLCRHPRYAAPERLIEGLRRMVRARGLAMFDS
jgi:RNA polymerase sigma factor (sigma-70 family)